MQNSGILSEYNISMNYISNQCRGNSNFVSRTVKHDKVNSDRKIFGFMW